MASENFSEANKNRKLEKYTSRNTSNKCHQSSRVDEKPVILSFSGFYGDDEPVLYWTQEASEKMWTNEPLQEICPITKVAKPRGYMKNYLQINKRNSSGSHDKLDSILNQYQSFRLKLSKTF